MKNIKVRFPFMISQTNDNTVEIFADPIGMPVPELWVNDKAASEFCHKVGISADQHQELLEHCQHEYVKRLVAASIKVES